MENILSTLNRNFGNSLKVKVCKHAIKINTSYIKADFEAFLSVSGIKYSRVTQNGFILPLN